MMSVIDRLGRTVVDVMFVVACDEGTFGIECAVSCHCKNNMPCDRFTGVCPGSLCAPGWLGRSCQTGYITCIIYYSWPGSHYYQFVEAYSSPSMPNFFSCL